MTNRQNSSSGGDMLTLDGVSMTFGALQALNAVTFEVKKGELLGLIGPNGSGKTTLFNVVTGVYRPTSGTVRMGSQDITGWKPHRIIALGVSRTFQNLRIFGRMTVFDNVSAAQSRLPDIPALRLIVPNSAEERRRRERVRELLDFIALDHKRDVLAKNLPLGEQRRLELARALAREPNLLLLDEPTGGMTPQETREMAGLIARVSEVGKAIVLIEHKMGMVMDLSRRIVVLNFGEKIAEGTPTEVQADPVVRQAYLGREAACA